MSLNKVIEANFLDPKEWHLPQLSQSGVLAVRQVLDTEGWKILKSKLFGEALKVMIMQALTAQEDHRYHQGVVEGFKRFDTIVSQLDQLHSSWTHEDIEQVIRNGLNGDGYDLH